MALSRDQFFMEHALLLAQNAAKIGEVPVGAVLVQNDKILSEGHNTVESQQDATAHAEIVVIREAGRKLDNWRLVDTTLYVTLEPCPMCMTAIMLARITTLVWGCSDPLMGASKLIIEENYFLRSRLKMKGGILANQAQNILKSVFRKKRKEKHEGLP